MAKKVALNIEVDGDGKIVVSPEGTQGEECINLMSFLDKIPGFNVENTVRTSDAYTKKVQLNTVQKISH